MGMGNDIAHLLYPISIPRFTLPIFHFHYQLPDVSAIARLPIPRFAICTPGSHLSSVLIAEDAHHPQFPDDADDVHGDVGAVGPIAHVFGEYFFSAVGACESGSKRNFRHRGAPASYSARPRTQRRSRGQRSIAATGRWCNGVTGTRVTPVRNARLDPSLVIGPA